jgi:GT2 family glycosyltransferase
MRLLIVIVNYRTAGLVLDCLASLAAQMDTVPGTRVLIADSASGDDSLPRLREALAERGWGRWASLLPLETNRGFAAGNDAAIRCALADRDQPQYVLLLNPDTVVHPMALLTLVEFMDRHPRAGIAGPRVEFADGTPQSSAFRFPTILSEFEGTAKLGLCTRLLSRWVVAPPPRTQEHAADWVSACAVVIRREVFEQIGDLDENYFMYYEEVDFCLRAAAAGWERWYVPSARVVHLVGQASGVTDRTRRKPRYWFDSRNNFYRKNFGWVYALLANAAFTLGLLVWSVRRRLQRLPECDPPHLLGDFVRHSLVRLPRFRPAAGRESISA